MDCRVSYPAVIDLDERSVHILFEGHARLDGDALVCSEPYREFVSRRLSLLLSELRVNDDGVVRFCIPVYDLRGEAVVPSYVSVDDGALLYAVLDHLRERDRQLADLWMAAIPDIDWFLKARRYLSMRRRLMELQESVSHLERQLYPTARSEVSDDRELSGHSAHAR